MSSAAVLDRARRTLEEAGLRGSFLVRDLDSGEEIGLEPDAAFPLASLVKVPLAIATLERVHRGELLASAAVHVEPGRITTPGPTGTSRFRHPASIAIDDLLYLSVSLSDNSAADALFTLTPRPAVLAELERLGLRGLSVRHHLRDLAETPVESLGPGQAHLAHSLAIGAATPGHGHALPHLDVSRANVGTARAVTEVLQELWRPRSVDVRTGERLRELLGANVFRQRLAPDFHTDSSRWSSKTGTLLNLRHEAGVVEHADGSTFAVTALTESSVSAAAQPRAEAAMAHVARTLRDHLRR
ncbi:serine hydrolase [Kineococcus sp. SYSU DK002]|uniref:serine hydrolase n=1 Tax=Kineococcus sp. SYSU DK002 TaxID=3383123 RepID=UPI003D7EDCF3